MAQGLHFIEPEIEEIVIKRVENMSVIKRKTILFTILAMVMMSSPSFSATLRWGQASDADLAGYLIYYGVESGVYTDTVDVGITDDYDFQNLTEGMTYYFSVSAYDSWGNKSEKSTEVSYQVTGVEENTDVDDGFGNAPEKFELRRNYPNPFNPETRIRFSVITPGKVKLVVYNVMGKMIRVLIDKEINRPFTEEVVWDGTDENGNNVTSGVYLCRLEQNQKARVQRMVLAR